MLKLKFKKKNKAFVFSLCVVCRDDMIEMGMPGRCLFVMSSESATVKTRINWEFYDEDSDQIYLL